MRSNTAIILILRDHMIPYRVRISRETRLVQVLSTDCMNESLRNSDLKPAWMDVPDIVTAMWVVGKDK